MTEAVFQSVLETAVLALSDEARRGQPCQDPKQFESLVLAAVRKAARGQGVDVAPTMHPHAFPDIAVNGYGIEVKHTRKDTWLAVGNSVFEGMRDQSVMHVYVVYGKMGGWPEVRWARYEDCITHVRISHAPRFVIEMDRASPLFSHIGVPYETFCKLSPDEKMLRIREYSRGRLKPGERLWWLEDQDHSLPIQVRMYMRLSDQEKRQLRAEAALLCPKICGPSRMRGKYDDAALYLLTRHGVFCPQTRDLFTAGSVAIPGNRERGGLYVQRALYFIQEEMRHAAQQLDDALFVEYWGKFVPPDKRITEWLRQADDYAQGWIPSQTLFLDG